MKPLITGMEEVFAAGPQIGEPVVGISLDIIDGAEHRFEAKKSLVFIFFISEWTHLRFLSSFAVKDAPNRF